MSDNVIKSCVGFASFRLDGACASGEPDDPRTARVASCNFTSDQVVTSTDSEKHHVDENPICDNCITVKI